MVPVLWSLWYGRPALPPLEPRATEFARRPQLATFYRRCGLSLQMDQEQKPVSPKPTHHYVSWTALPGSAPCLALSHLFFRTGLMHSALADANLSSPRRSYGVGRQSEQYCSQRTGARPCKIKKWQTAGGR